MNVHHLELFYYVAKYQGITEAVRRMPYGIQQPAVSGQMLQLEKHLGIRLFHRRPFALTPAGEELYQYVHPFFSRMAQVEERLKGEQSRHLRLAVFSTVLTHHLPEVLHLMREEFPDLRITLKELNRAELEHAVRQQDVDLALTPISGRQMTGGIKSQRLISLPLLLAAPAACHANEFNEIVSLGAGGQVPYPLVSLPRTSPVSHLFQEGLKDSATVWEPTLEVTDLSVLLRYVAKGFGFGVMLDLPRETWPEGVKKITLPASFAPMHIGVMHTGELKPVASRFIEMAVEYAKKLQSRR